MVQVWEHTCPGTIQIGFKDAGEMVIACYAVGDPPSGNLLPPLDAWSSWVDGGAPTFGSDADGLNISGLTADDKGRWMTDRDIAVTAGQSYEMTGRLVADATLGTFSLAVTWWTAELAYLSSTTAQPIVSGVADAQVRAQAAAPSGAAFARVEFRAMNGIAGIVGLSVPWFGLSEPETLDEALLEKAEQEQVIEFNPSAALQKAIFADGFVPNSPEFDITHQGKVYRGQRAENLATGEVRVYYAALDDWEHVLYVVRT